MDDSKACTRCEMNLPLTEFYVRRASSDGRTVACKSCVKADIQDRYRRNRDEILRKQKVHRQENPEFYRAKQAAAHLRNRDKRNARAAERRADPNYAERARLAAETWRKQNPELYAESQRKYRESHLAERAENVRRWHQLNRDAARAMRARRSAHIRGVQCVRFTPKQLADRLAVYGNRCWMCRGTYEHLDHVKPVSKGGAHMLANLRPSCARCNLSKKDKWQGPAWSLSLKR